MRNSLIYKLNTGMQVEHTVYSRTDDLYQESYKYTDGRLVINIRRKITVSITSPSGSLYFARVNLPEFPMNFIEKPTCLFFSEERDGNAWVWGGNPHPSSTSPGQVIIARATQVSNTTIGIIVHAEGRWK